MEPQVLGLLPRMLEHETLREAGEIAPHSAVKDFRSHLIQLRQVRIHSRGSMSRVLFLF